jgi:putative hydrolase of the HAD superfamily
VLFDFAGVLTSSPWGPMTAAGGGNLELLIGSYEEDGDHPWHRVERGEIPITDWAVAVTEMGKAQGIAVDFTPLQSMLGDMTINEQVVARVRTLRRDGYRVGLITNNVREGSGSWRALLPVDELFEVVVDSSEVGMRKPNPAIFHHALDLLGGVAPEEAVFLDDAPGNVAGAQRAGLHAIHVDDPDQALADLDALLAG